LGSQQSQNEIAVVGSLLISPEVLPIIEKYGLTPENFSVDECRAVMAAAYKLRDEQKPIDVVTLGQYAADVSGMDLSQWLIEAMQITPTAAHIESYCEIVKREAKRRSLRTALSNAAIDIAYGDAREIADSVAGEILRFNDGEQNTIITGGALRESFLSYYKQAKEDPDSAFCRTGIQALDAQLGGGLFRSEVYVIGARPGMGKTTLGINIAQNVVNMGKRVLFVSLEMTEEQIQAKRIAYETGLAYTDLLTGRLPSYSEATMLDCLDRLDNESFFLTTRSDMTVGEIQRIARQIENLDLIIIDYMGLMPVPIEAKAKPRYEQMTEISAGIKSIAKTLNLPILALSQLNRENTMRSDKRPTLSDLRDSGAIEQDAGGVILLHRPEYYEQRENAEQKEAEEIELNVAKSRHSSPGLVRMIWSGSNGRIAQKDEQNAESRTEWAEGDELPF